MIAEELVKLIRSRYRETQYPAISEQWSEFSATKPFEGLKILDITPIYFNTSLKWLSIILGGGDLTIGISNLISYDNNCVQWLRSIGIRVVDVDHLKVEQFDLVSDCAGVFADVVPAIGAVELTGSGLDKYRDSDVPCFFADNSRVKRIEAELGTGDGMARGLNHFGLDIASDQRWVLFGYGKIGKGIASVLRDRGVKDLKIVEIGKGDGFIDGKVINTVDNIVDNSTHVVTATAQKGLLSALYSRGSFVDKLLINMGAEDEFGDNFCDSDVLNNKIAINFALEEPTDIQFIEGTFALVNYGLEWLIQNSKELRSGIYLPEDQLQDKIINTIKDRGEIESLIVEAKI